MSSHDQESIRERVWRAAVTYGRVKIASAEPISTWPAGFIADLAAAERGLVEVCIEAAKSEERPEVKPC